MASKSDALYALIEADINEYMSSCFVPPTSPSRKAATYLLENVMDKFIETSDSADSAAWEKFIESNERAKAFSKSFSERNFMYPTTGYILELAEHSIARCFSSVDGVFDYESFCDSWDLGNGSNARGNTNSFLGKVFCGRLATTSIQLYNLYCHGMRSYTWKLGEQIRRAKYGVDVIDTSSITFVPKNRRISRVIATEPAVNMMFQKSLSAILVNGLKTHYGINMSTQPDVNRRLAKQYSVTDTGFTLDLSSASDSITLPLVEYLFKSTQFFKWASLCRTKAVTHKTETVELSMMCTMGNGFCSSLQTIVFASLMQACYDLIGLSGRVAVFGDDMIGDNRIFDLLVKTLSDLGFQPNEKKSFSRGPFRESCGHDYWNGSNIRPVFIKSLDGHHSIYSAFNRLQRWSLHWLIPLKNTLRWLARQAPRQWIPYTENDIAGFKTPVPPRKEILHGWCVAFPYSAWLPIPKTISVLSDTFNSPGIIQALIRGDVRDNMITIRRERLKEVYAFSRKHQPISWVPFGISRSGATTLWDELWSFAFSV